ncbi:MAG: polyprenyl synthetase family protein [Thermoplasmata archaeon]
MASWDLPISKELSMVAEVIEESITSQEQLLTEIASYVIRSGGKRIRPAVTLLSFYAVGGTDVQDAVKIAAALELIHNATLIHDDINDGGTTRRGKPAAYKKYGIQNALVTGDFLFTKAFAIGGRFDSEIVDITAQACVQLAEGEIRQKIHSRDLSMSEEDYIGIIRRKTAWPISAGARIGAILGGGSVEQILALGQYGTNLGIAFQIVDDILDVVGNEEVLGKPTGTDVREGNITLLTLNALQDGRKGDREELAGIIKKRRKTEAEVRRALDIVVISGAVEVARQKATEFGKRAKESLGLIPPTQYKLELLKMVDLVLNREV